jgi:hypothetical protein
VLRLLALAHFPEDVGGGGRHAQAEKHTDQQPGDAAVFVAATEVVAQAEEEKRVGEALQVVNGRTRTVVGSRQTEEEAWALAATVAVHQDKEVMEVAARQTVALLQSQSIDIATVESTAGPFLGSYHAAVDLVASANDAAMAEAYVVGMGVPQEEPTRRAAGTTTSRPSLVTLPKAMWSCR